MRRNGGSRGSSTLSAHRWRRPGLHPRRMGSHRRHRRAVPFRDPVLGWLRAAGSTLACSPIATPTSPVRLRVPLVVVPVAAPVLRDRARAGVCVALDQAWAARAISADASSRFGLLFMGLAFISCSLRARRSPLKQAASQPVVAHRLEPLLRVRRAVPESRRPQRHHQARRRSASSVS